jgi:hypothetical protein
MIFNQFGWFFLLGAPLALAAAALGLFMGRKAAQLGAGPLESRQQARGPSGDEGAPEVGPSRKPDAHG